MSKNSNFRLLSHQLVLYQALKKKNNSLASMYYGALKVLNDVDNPERFILAAHGIRELMEKILQYLDVDVKVLKERLKDKVREVEKIWDSCCKQSRCYDSSDWNGYIDAHLKNFLKYISNFFEWFKKYYPKRRSEITKIIRELDFMEIPLPKPIEDLKIKEWNYLWNFFIAVSHHHKDVEKKEFDKWLLAFERFLLNYLYPRTFDDFEKIDEIIKEVEKE